MRKRRHDCESNANCKKEDGGKRRIISVDTGALIKDTVTESEMIKISAGVKSFDDQPKTVTNTAETRTEHG